MLFRSHRVGRTGRGFAKGEALSFFAPEEKEKLALIEEFIQTKIPRLKVHEQHLQGPETIPDAVLLADMIALEEANIKQFKKRKKKPKS